MSGVKKFILAMVVIFCIFMAVSTWIAGPLAALSSDVTVEEAAFGASVGGWFFMILAIGIPIAAYYVSGKVCPICKSEEWGVPE